jgi:hypothetical protein
MKGIAQIESVRIGPDDPRYLTVVAPVCAHQRSRFGSDASRVATTQRARPSTSTVTTSTASHGSGAVGATDQGAVGSAERVPARVVHPRGMSSLAPCTRTCRIYLAFRRTRW